MVGRNSLPVRTRCNWLPQQVAVQRGDNAAVYYVPFAGGTAEVRSWTTGTGAAPSDGDLGPLLSSIK
ncbi:MAG: hypothetical protein KatS3mg062_1450 [Tepidiforma sp.]|nr:MAG: hypothetical protein KatS3mg062_1450 [Tepidiforma sp.]